MNSISFDVPVELIKSIATVGSSFLGRAVVVLQANAALIVAAIVIIAAVVIGVKCYQAYMALKSENAKLKEINKNLSEKIAEQNQKATEQNQKSVDQAKQIEEILESNQKLKNKLILAISIFFQSKAQNPVK